MKQCVGRFPPEEWAAAWEGASWGGAGAAEGADVGGVGGSGGAGGSAGAGGGAGGGGTDTAGASVAPDGPAREPDAQAFCQPQT